MGLNPGDHLGADACCAATLLLPASCSERARTTASLRSFSLSRDSFLFVPSCAPTMYPRGFVKIEPGLFLENAWRRKNRVFWGAGMFVCVIVLVRTSGGVRFGKMEDDDVMYVKRT